MTSMMLATRKRHYDNLDAIAQSISRMDLNGTQMTEAILSTIIELYETAKIETAFKNELFETAYHAPITSELEFLLARILYRYAENNLKGWKIYLRRQVNKTAPDIRIEVLGRTLGVIEVKAKVGWIQPMFSPVTYQRDFEKHNNKTSNYNPDEVIRKSRAQLEKYETSFRISKDDIFLFLPTLARVHRKKHATTVEEYYQYFAGTSGLSASNLVLLSHSLSLDLSSNRSDLMPTNNFERMITSLSKRTAALNSM